MAELTGGFPGCILMPQNSDSGTGSARGHVIVDAADVQVRDDGALPVWSRVGERVAAPASRPPLRCARE